MMVWSTLLSAIARMPSKAVAESVSGHRPRSAPTARAPRPGSARRRIPVMDWPGGRTSYRSGSRRTV